MKLILPETGVKKMEHLRNNAISILVACSAIGSGTEDREGFN